MTQSEMRGRALRFCDAHGFLRKLLAVRSRLSHQQIKTLRGQALSGDIEGAERGLCRLMRGGENYNDAE